MAPSLISEIGTVSGWPPYTFFFLWSLVQLAQMNPQVWQKEVDFASEQFWHAISLLSAFFKTSHTSIMQSIDEEHSGEGAGIITCHSNDTATLGTLHLLVTLLFQ